MKTYETTSMLGYGQFSYFVKTYTGLLVIWSNNSVYEVGQHIEDTEDIILDESHFNIEESPLYNTFLFQYFIKTYKEI